MSQAKLNDEESTTLHTYDTIAAAWSAQHDEPEFWEEQLDRFQSLLPDGHIVEIGTGGARDAIQLIKRGYGYTGSDISAGLLQVARAKVPPDTELVQQSVYDLDFGGQQFDGFWASAVLLHIPKARIGEALARIRSVVREGAIGFISLKEGEGERMEHAEVDSGTPGRFFAYYRHDEFANILQQNGFAVVDYAYRPMSEKTRWLGFFVQKLPSSVDKSSK